MNQNNRPRHYKKAARIEHRLYPLCLHLCERKRISILAKRLGISASALIRRAVEYTIKGGKINHGSYKHRIPQKIRRCYKFYLNKQDMMTFKELCQKDKTLGMFVVEQCEIIVKL